MSIKNRPQPPAAPNPHGDHMEIELRHRLPKVPMISFKEPDPSYFATLEANTTKRNEIPKKLLERFGSAQPRRESDGSSSNPDNELMRMAALSAEEAAEHAKIDSSMEEWALMTGWHGVVDMFYAKQTWMKLLWAMVIAVGAFLGLNETSSLIMDFVNGDKWVTSMQYVQPENGAVEWPNMTITNLNWLQTKVLHEKYNLTDDALIAYIINYDIGAVDFYERYNTDNEPTEFANASRKEEIQYKAFFKQLGKSRDTFMDEIAQNCNDTIIHCGNSERFDMRLRDYTCCGTSRLSKQRISSFTVDLAKTFGGRTEMSKPGYDGGLYFILDPKSDDDYELVRKQEKPSNGFIVYLYYGDDNLDNSESLFITPGTHTVISVTGVRYQIQKSRPSLLPWDTPRLPCVDASNGYNYQFMNKTEYSIKLCEEECKAEYLKLTYNCSCQNAATVDLKSSDLYCDTNSTQLDECQRKLKEIESTRNFDQFKSRGRMNLSRCMTACIEPCQYDLITAKMSRARFPTDLKVNSFKNMMNRALKTEYTEDSVKLLTLLEVYFETNSRLVNEKVRRYSVDDLISNIGGSLGVWTGISVISVVQAMIYVIFATKQVIDFWMYRTVAPEPVFKPTKEEEEARELSTFDYLRHHGRPPPPAAAPLQKKTGKDDTAV